MSWPFGDLVPLRYGVILADPPWAYAMRSPKGHAKSPEAHYATMDAEALAALPVGQLAGRDCMLVMWSTWPHLPQALWLMQEWGFRFVTGGAWCKRAGNGAPVMGTGYVVRSATEPFLFGRIGRPKPASKAVRNLIEAPGGSGPLIDALRREHSRKPDAMRAMIDRLFPDVPGCELFARAPWAGRDVWGLETDRFPVVRVDGGAA